MGLRITDEMRQATVLADLQDASTRLSKTQEVMASGRTINQPSDNPYGTSQALGLSSDLSATGQYQRNVSEAMGWQNVTDSALTTMNNSVQRVRELLIQGSSDSAGPDARSAAAQEIDQLIESVKQDGDATYEGRYVFAGTATGTKPYAVGGSDAYAGDSGAVARAIGPGVSVQVNVLGSTILGSAGGDGKLLDTLRNISAHLKGGTTADMDALRTTDLAQLDQNSSTIMQAQATVGATTNRLQTADSRLQDVSLATTQLLSNVEDADMAKTMTDFSMQQSVYQAALRAGANIVQDSLMDFLR
jgi:flagellar hook-associated protein 3 FlgL